MGDGKMPARPVERGPSDAQGQAPRPMPAPDAMQSAGPDVGPHARPNAKPETATDAVTSAVTPSGPKPANTVIRLPAAKPELLVKHAPQNAHHIIATRSHQLDLALCDGVLRRGFGSAGVIGSKTKWARFRSRLRDAGHSNAEIDSIICPIGDPALGKHPRAIAVGVASALLQLTALQTAGGDVSG